MEVGTGVDTKLDEHRVAPLAAGAGFLVAGAWTLNGALESPGGARPGWLLSRSVEQTL